MGDLSSARALAYENTEDVPRDLDVSILYIVTSLYLAHPPRKYGNKGTLRHIKKILMDLPLLLLTYGCWFANYSYSQIRLA